METMKEPTREATNGEQASVPFDQSRVCIDLQDERTIRKYLGFTPIENYIMGLRYYASRFDDSKASSGTFETWAMTPNGPELVETAQPGLSMNIIPAGMPHHVTGLFGYWHVNSEDEIYVPVPLANGDAVLVVLEGASRAGREDRFVEYCQQCYTKLYEKVVRTGVVGVASFFTAQEDAVKEFNSDKALRTCPNCGALHPLAYDMFFFLKGTREERRAAEEW